MHNARLFWGICAGFCSILLAAACSSSSSAGTTNSGDASTSSDGAASSSEGGGSTNCVAPGTPNNELGIGGYCTTAADCPGELCTAQFGAPPNAWFCSKICAQGQSCGSNEVCAVAAQGVACVPLICFGDGGVIFDAGSSDQ
jgi:hypothetical protein